LATPAVSAQSLYAEVNGQRLHYKKWSDGGPPLIFLHGVTSSSASWDLVAPRFARDFTTLALDLRGHGASSKPDRGYHWSGDYAADVLEFVQTRLNAPAVLIGHSLGAMVAAPVAARAPDKVRAIVMEDPPAFRRSDPAQSTGERFRPVLGLKRLPMDIRTERLMEDSGLNRAAARRRAEELEAMHEAVLLELMGGKTAYDPQDWFPRVTCPALVVVGAPHRGGAVQYEDRPRLQRLMPRARLVEYDDVGHLVHFHKLDRFVQDVEAFISELPPANQG
jgi:pimeloyl-ACP methyl ester carboxylesterase